jgi:pimeloyl-ACP methyl ester carboxylesterase
LHILPNKDMSIIFIHGSGAYGDIWHYQTEHFPSSHAVNLPGHPHGQLLNSVGAYADWLKKYIEGRGYKDVILAGHSLGGAITLMYALRYPQELKAIIVIDSGARLRVHPRYLAACEEAIKGSPQQWYQIVEEIYRLTPGNYRRETVEKQKAIGPAVMLNDFLACDKFDIMDKVQQIQLPTLVICGELDAMTPVKYADYLAAEIANSRLAIISQATHLALAEKPETVNKAIEEFVNGISF